MIQKTLIPFVFLYILLDFGDKSWYPFMKD